MKTNLMPHTAAAFTLIEMVGVIAVIALLVGFLVPKVFSAIDNARFNHTVASLTTVNAAAVGYFGKYGRFGEVGGGLLTTSGTNWDNVLVAEQFLETPFSSRIGDRPSIQVLTVPADATPGTGGCFNLSGASGDVLPAGSRVVVAMLENVSASEALELSQRIDGPTLSVTGTTQADTLGRVTYPAGAGTVTIYLSHQ